MYLKAIQSASAPSKVVDGQNIRPSSPTADRLFTLRQVSAEAVSHPSVLPGVTERTKFHPNFLVVKDNLLSRNVTCWTKSNVVKYIFRNLCAFLNNIKTFLELVKR